MLDHHFYLVGLLFRTPQVGRHIMPTKALERRRGNHRWLLCPSQHQLLPPTRLSQLLILLSNYNNNTTNNNHQLKMEPLREATLLHRKLQVNTEMDLSLQRLTHSLQSNMVMLERGT